MEEIKMNAGRLSVVMPAYNEGKNIYHNIERVRTAVEKFADDYEIIVVNDGSSDHTKDEVLRAQKESSRVRLVSYRKNRGKGGAIKKGVAEAGGEYIAFLDADLDLPPEQLEKYLEQLKNNRADVVIGSKMHKDSELDYPLVRRIISFGYYSMLKILFHLNVKDTQTGIKMFRAEALKSIIGLVKIKGFAYDIEILVALNCRKYRIMEMPVKLVFGRENGMGRIKLKDILQVFSDTWKIFWRANVRKDYRKL